jgi:predicted membrane protein
MENNTNLSKKNLAKGFILMSIGALLLARNFGAELPTWLLSLPSLLIVLGIYNGIKHNFAKPTWLVLVLVGAVFMAQKFAHLFEYQHLVLPVVLIGLGLHKLLYAQKHEQEQPVIRTFQNP